MGRSFEAAQERICNYGGDGAVEEGHLKTERGHAASITRVVSYKCQVPVNRSLFPVLFPLLLDHLDVIH